MIITLIWSVSSSKQWIFTNWIIKLQTRTTMAATVGNSFEFCAEFPQSRASSARKHDFAMIPLFYGEADPYWRCPWNYPSHPQQLLALDYFQNSQSYAKTRVVILTLPSPFLNKRIEMLSCMDGLGLPVVWRKSTWHSFTAWHSSVPPPSPTPHPPTHP